MPNHPAKVLLAEDDRFLRRAAETTLRRHGLTVVTAVDGDEALAAARRELPDLILLDMIMPKVQGFEVLQALKEDPTTAAIPVVVLSNLSQESDSKTACQMGALDYWVKANISLEELARRVTGLISAAVP
jgi:CheY-like chemotaxis protein